MNWNQNCAQEIRQVKFPNWHFPQLALPPIGTSPNWHFPQLAPSPTGPSPNWNFPNWHFPQLAFPPTCPRLWLKSPNAGTERRKTCETAAHGRSGAWELDYVLLQLNTSLMLAFFGLFKVIQGLIKLTGHNIYKK